MQGLRPSGYSVAGDDPSFLRVRNPRETHYGNTLLGPYSFNTDNTLSERVCCAGELRFFKDSGTHFRQITDQSELSVRGVPRMASDIRPYRALAAHQWKRSANRKSARVLKECRT
jgi:hypothetical protein